MNQTKRFFELLTIAVIFAACFSQPLLAGSRQKIVERSKVKHLHTSTHWLRLGHWRQDIWSSFESEIDDPDFFISPHGKKSPKKELRATLRAMLAPANTSLDLEDHVACRFPARVKFLVQALALEDLPLPSTNDCPQLDKFLARSLPSSVSVIFSAYYISNPSSAFGHTFLRLNRPIQGATETRDLLNLAVNYAATTSQDGPLLFSFKGLGGAYKGNFAFVPYFYKVREYSDYESRDLWEYELNLSTEAKQYLSLHLYELGQIYIDYYFLHENCSFHILSLLEAAEPKLNLLDQVSRLVLPADTIKALFHNKGLVQKTVFRPSLRSKFEASFAGLKANEQHLVEHLLRNTDTKIPEEINALRNAKILDAATDLNDLRFAKEILLGDGKSPAQRTKHNLLIKRALLGASGNYEQQVTQPQFGPHETHPLHRLSLFNGWDSQQGMYQALAFRLGIHGLADPVAGYPEQFDVGLLQAKLAIFDEKSSLRLQELRIVSVRSLTPLSRFFGGVSYAGHVGARYLNDNRCQDCTVGDIAFATGVSWLLLPTSGSLSFTAWVMGMTGVLFHQEIAGIGDSSMRVPLGLQLGFALRLNHQWTILSDILPEYAILQTDSFRIVAHNKIRWNPFSNLGLSLSVDNEHELWRSEIGAHIYF